MLKGEPSSEDTLLGPRSTQWVGAQKANTFFWYSSSSSSSSNNNNNNNNNNYNNNIMFCCFGARNTYVQTDRIHAWVRYSLLEMTFGIITIAVGIK